MHRSCSCHQMLQTFWAESLYNSLLVNVLLQNIPCHFWKILNVLFATFCNMWWWPSSVYQFYVKQIWNLRENRRNKSYLLNYDLLTRHHSEIKPVLHWFSSNMFRFKPAWKVELGRLMFSSLKGHSSQSPSKRLNAIGNGCVRFNILSHTHMIWSTSFIPSILPSDWKLGGQKKPASSWVEWRHTCSCPWVPWRHAASGQGQGTQLHALHQVQAGIRASRKWARCRDGVFFWRRDGAMKLIRCRDGVF